MVKFFKLSWRPLDYLCNNALLFSSESQTEISEVEQDLKRAQDLKIDVERKLRLIEEEKQALEKVN